MNGKEFLKHSGILGMHWGKRKAKTTKKTESNNLKLNDDYLKARKLNSMGSKNLSTAELKELTQRLQLEKQLKDLKPNEYKRGLNIVKEITAAGTTIASLYALSKTPLFQDVVKAVKNRG